MQAPLPRGWEIYKDKQGEPIYFHRRNGTTTYCHPADEYFMNKVLEDRTRHVKAVQEGESLSVARQGSAGGCRGYQCQGRVGGSKVKAVQEGV